MQRLCAAALPTAGDQRQPAGPGLCGFGQRGQGALDICLRTSYRLVQDWSSTLAGRPCIMITVGRLRGGRRTLVVAVVVVVTMLGLS